MASLLTLSTETRLQIYEHVIGNPTVRIERRKARLHVKGQDVPLLVVCRFIYQEGKHEL
jgi:hypothetical protein